MTNKSIKFFFLFFFFSCLQQSNLKKRTGQESSSATITTEIDSFLLLTDTLKITSKQEAIKYAEKVLIARYGNRILNKRPFVAQRLDSTIWAVEGTLPEGLFFGGVPYIEFTKNGYIIIMKHGK